MRNLKQALNHGLVFKKLHRIIKFNQNAWLRPYNDMSTDLRKKAKKKSMKNMRKHRDIKLVTTERRRNLLVSEPNYHTKKFFTKYLLATEMKKQK